MELVWQGKGPEVYGKLVRKMKHLTSFYHNNQHVRAAMFVINSDPDQEDMLHFSRPNETRWSSIFLMGERLMANYTFMWEHAGSLGLGEDKYLSPLDIRVVGELLAVLAPFYKATQLFQTTDGAAISYIYPTILRLLFLMDVDQNASFDVPTPTGITPKNAADLGRRRRS